MTFSTTTFRRTLTTSVVTLAISLGYGLTTIAQALTLNGAGATFPKPLYDRYFAEFNRKNPDVQVNYEGIGSGGGIKQLTEGTVDFAGSDAAMTDEQIRAVSKGVVFIPTAGGAVAVVYNLPGVSNLKVSRSVLPAIFKGEITRWNDPKIVADNPGVNLPNRPIRLVVRADSSGTSFIFTNHLSAINADFKNRIGAKTAPTWIGSPLSGKGNSGVGALVQQTEGAIGYVEASFSKSSNIPTALVQGKSGRYVAPTIAEANKALTGVQFKNDLRIDFANPSFADPADGYPITGLTWLMFYKSYEPAKTEAIKKLVQWMMTDGQAINNSLEYTQLPQATRTLAIQAVNNNIASR